jgi:type VI secretion system secreted protein VgrG
MQTIEILAPAEAGPLVFQSMQGGERLGRPFEYNVDLSSRRGDLPSAGMLGRPLSVKLPRRARPPRWFNGMVARLAQVGWNGEQFHYQATLRPLMWLLTRSSNCRVFQNQSVPELVMEMLGAHGVPARKQLGRAGYAPREYVVQYNETDFNFVSRLMEQEGISYYFAHEEGKHTLILIDALTVHDQVPGSEAIPFSSAGDRARDGDGAPHERVDAFAVATQIEPGAYVGKDFDFEQPRAPLLSIAHAPTVGAQPAGERFEYPARYLDAGERDDYVKRRLEQEQADEELAQGGGNAGGITCGFRFTLTEHPAEPNNRDYLVIAATHLLATTHPQASGAPAEAGPDYRCAFVGIDGRRPYRTPSGTPRPQLPGPQTAIVVGPKGEEIWTDRHGRIKVQFHWDRQGARDEKSSCWVRVAQAWAGSQWGAIHIPRIGQEVVVDFLDGDPDRPIVTGRVYNGDNLPPYDLPANQTQSGMKSRSTKNGGPSHFNELRFEDKTGAEQVYLQAEKDLQLLIKNDERRAVGHDRSAEIGRDEIAVVGNHRTVTVGQDDALAVGANRRESVARDQTLEVGGQRAATVALGDSSNVGGARSLSVGLGDSTSVTGAQSVAVGLAQTVAIGGARTLLVGKDEAISVGGQRTVSVSKDQTVEIGHKLTITAAEEITLTTGEASIHMNKNGDITIKGKTITLDGSAKANIKATGEITIKGSKVVQN